MQQRGGARKVSLALSRGHRRDRAGDSPGEKCRASYKDFTVTLAFLPMSENATAICFVGGRVHRRCHVKSLARKQPGETATICCTKYPQ